MTALSSVINPLATQLNAILQRDPEARRKLFGWRYRPFRKTILKLRKHGSPFCIQGLPMELLIEILLMALNDTEWSTEDLRRLASVCRYWREVIVKTPQFWMLIDMHHEKGSWSQVLSKNPAGPLDVRIWGYRGYYWRDADRFRDFVNLLKPESKRIRSIDSNVPLHSAYIPTFLNGAPFPILSDVKIIISPPPWTPYLFNVGDGVPFQHLQLSGVVIPWDSPRLSGLETMSIWGVQSNTPSFSELHRALSSSPRLRRLCLFNWNISINHTNSSPKDTKPLPQIHLPHLSSLAISSISDPINSHLLSILEAPMLKDIRWLSVRGLDSGSTLLRLSGRCIRMSQELVIHWTEWSRRLVIKSEPWSDSPSSKPTVSEVGKTVDMGIDGIQDPSHLMGIAAEFLGPWNKVLFTTSSETVMAPVGDILQSSGAKLVVRLSSLTR